MSYNVEASERFDSLLREEKLNHFEGEKGVQNLARLARCLGYKDEQYFGQFSHQASYGDLLEFLQDNSGACDALVEWARDNAIAWSEHLPELFTDEDEDDEEVTEEKDHKNGLYGPEYKGEKF